jgi:hypothetical protein
MEEFDTIIKDKLESRTIQPSDSAWERLSEKLDETDTRKSKKWIWYLGYAASILIALSLFFMNSDDKVEEQIIKDEIIVDNPVEKPLKIEEVIDREEDKQILVAEEKVEIKVPEKKSPKRSTHNKLENKLQFDEKLIHDLKEEKTVIAIVEKESISNAPGNKFEELKSIKRNPNSRIKIDSDALLYAVTHNSEEVKKYYAKYNVNRQDALESIKKQLDKSNIKVSPEMILTEVEKTIEEDDFQNNFLKFLKKRVTNITTAIASRNK